MCTFTKCTLLILLWLIPVDFTRQSSREKLSYVQYCTCDSFRSLLYNLQALEKFNFEAMSLLTKLEEIHEGLIHQDYADNLVALREQVKHNQHVRKWIIKAPIETLEEEGSRLLEWITENKLKYADAASEDWKVTSARIKNILENLQGKRQKLKDSWHIRKRRLDQCIQYHLFHLDAEKVSRGVSVNI